jgi:hypothetical protein
MASVMFLPAKMKSTCILAVLIALLTLCLAGNSTSPNLTKEQIDELKSQLFKLIQEEKYKQAS